MQWLILSRLPIQATMIMAVFSPHRADQDFQEALERLVHRERM